MRKERIYTVIGQNADAYISIRGEVPLKKLSKTRQRRGTSEFSYVGGGGMNVHNILADGREEESLEGYEVHIENFPKLNEIFAAMQNEKAERDESGGEK